MCRVLLLYAQLVYWTEFLLCKFVFLARGEQAKHTLIINNRSIKFHTSHAATKIVLRLFLSSFIAIHTTFNSLPINQVIWFYVFPSCRRLYHLFSYMWLFLNLFVGLFSAFKRIITSAVLSLLLVMRMDRVVLMKGFERFDFGESEKNGTSLWQPIILFCSAHKTYIGFIYLDYIQNHSVVNTFVILLQQSLPRKDINITVINSELTMFLHIKIIIILV